MGADGMSCPCQERPIPGFDFLDDCHRCFLWAKEKAVDMEAHFQSGQRGGMPRQSSPGLLEQKAAIKHPEGKVPSPMKSMHSPHII